METFKIRCSAIGQIMGLSGMITPRQLEEIKKLEEKKASGKDLTTNQSEIYKALVHKRDNPQLSQTAKTYCRKWVKEQLYSRRKAITSKYLDKGNIMEESSLDLIAEKMGYGLLVKNEERLSNEYMEGEPDCLLPSHIIDVKNSFDCFTFPLFETTFPNDDYYWQGQGYMELFDRNSYKLIYTLMDMPEEIIKKEFKWNNPLEKSYEEFKKEYLYSHLGVDLRVKCFPFERSQEDINKIKLHVELCREYIKELLKSIK